MRTTTAPRRPEPVLGFAVLVSLLLGSGVGLLLSEPATLLARTLGGPQTTVQDPGRVQPVPAADGLSPKARFVVVSNDLFVFDGPRAWHSKAGQSTWTSIKLPSGAGDAVLNVGAPARLLAGGPAIYQSADVGATWSPAKAAPPGSPPFQALLISSVDPKLWFVSGGGHLLRTRDAGASWTVLPGLPPVSTAVVAPTSNPAEFVVAIGSRVVELTNFGDQVRALPKLPSGSAVQLVVVSQTEPPVTIATTDSSKTYQFRNSAWQEVPGGLSGPLAGTLNGRAWLGDGGRNMRVPARVNVTTDGGISWKPGTGLPTDQTVEGISAATPNGGDVWALTVGGELYQSLTAGATWRDVGHGTWP